MREQMINLTGSNQTDIHINGEDLEYKQYPKTKVEVFAYGFLKPHRDNRNDKVVEIFFREIEKDNPEVFKREINIKLLPLLNLSRIIENQALTYNFTHNDTLELEFDTKIATRKQGWQIPEIKNFRMLLGEKENYFAFKEQYFLEILLTEKGIKPQKRLLIPEYVILNQYYLLSDSLVNTLMRSDLTSLYYPDTVKYDESSKVGSIIFKDKSAHETANEVFRFITNNYANNQWHEIQRRIVSSGIILEEFFKRINVQYNDESLLSAGFPTDGLVPIKIAYKDIGPHTKLGLRILSDGVPYDCKNLTGIYLKDIRSKDDQSDTPLNPTETKTVKPINDVANVVDETPNSKNLDVVAEYSADKIRGISLGLEDVTTEFATEEREIKGKKLSKIFNNDQNPINHLSANDASSFGEEDIAKGSFALKNEDSLINDYERQSIKLDEFTSMVNECIRLQKNFTFSISKHFLMPLKNSKSRSRKTNLTFFEGSILRRKYMFAQVITSTNLVTFIEIERGEKTLKSASTLIITSPLDTVGSDEIAHILQKVVDAGLIWPKITKKLLWSSKNLNKDLYAKSITLSHPKKNDILDIKAWAKRALKKIN